jgi:Mg-chelatase subunit ChlI
MAVAGRASAALRGKNEVAIEDIVKVAPLALQHRRPGVQQTGHSLWSNEDTDQVRALLNGSMKK